MSEQIFIANFLSWFFHQQIYEKNSTDENVYEKKNCKEIKRFSFLYLVLSVMEL